MGAVDLPGGDGDVDLGWGGEGYGGGWMLVMVVERKACRWVLDVW